MGSKLLMFYNCFILRDHKLIEENLWVSGGRIIDPEHVFFDLRRCADEEINCNGAILVPGFIDIQINGGFGVDFSHDFLRNNECVKLVASKLLSHGVTSFCPTIVTSKPQLYHSVLKNLKPMKGGLAGAEVLGLHLEGPFINKVMKGAHEIESIVDFDQGVDSVKDVYGEDLSYAKIVTLAPEKKNSIDVIKWLRTNNIVVALGHSEADVESGERAINNGATLITHLFNAMLPFHHRNPGLIGLLGTNLKQSVFYGLIADGIHTHPSALRIAFRSHPNGVVLVTDAISAMGLENGVHYIGEKKIEISGNSAYISGTKTLCGSIAQMNKCVQYFMKATNCSLVEALEAASLHPAQVLGIEKRKGTLDFGSDADFVLIDSDINIISTWIAGECVYSKPELK